jgi:hypothetical protein
VRPKLDCTYFPTTEYCAGLICWKCSSHCRYPSILALRSPLRCGLASKGRHGVRVNHDGSTFPIGWNLHDDIISCAIFEQHLAAVLSLSLTIILPPDRYGPGCISGDLKVFLIHIAVPEDRNARCWRRVLRPFFIRQQSISEHTSAPGPPLQWPVRLSSCFPNFSLLADSEDLRAARILRETLTEAPLDLCYP